jgi:hypothetical protein
MATARRRGKCWRAGAFRSDGTARHKDGRGLAADNLAGPNGLGRIAIWLLILTYLRHVLNEFDVGESQAAIGRRAATPPVRLKE